ncbi:MAG: hypothetical protein HMLKMBBP_03302 [Planctomycetes bacterium]|nr:hypothetical protein [Planctomycetota bacterium]
MRQDDGSASAPDVAASESPVLAAMLGSLAEGRARLAFVRTETTGESGVARIAARIVNRGRLPTHTARGVETRARRPLDVRAELPQGASLAAGAPSHRIERLAGGAESDEMRWVVAGPSGAVVRIVCTGPDTDEVVHEARIP